MRGRFVAAACCEELADDARRSFIKEQAADVKADGKRCDEMAADELLSGDVRIVGLTSSVTLSEVSRASRPCLNR